MTNITIIGSGNMARGIGTRAVVAGSGLQILDRDPAKAASLAAELGAEVTSGTLTSPLTGEIVVLALPFDAAKEVVTALGAALSGKTVIDITNPVDFSTFDSLVVAPGTSAAEELAALAAPGATVVKAFNTTFAGALVAGTAAGLPLDVFIASDSDEANAAVAAFVTAAGQRPIVVGPLRRARELEGFQFLVMTLQANPAFEDFNWNTSLKVLV
ncbi:NAD(P)-binding domain-containing protein [Cryobacterium breve]|uniref:NAD(P)-binding domain-containing protein n=1 Tax=Cryobacterium breve TaxID=1259258 RepID=A0ABY7NGK7_9MICO|nr:NAD(P)-binding domain-containing protein [Cryobacterium breve]WBM81117.1 NAD(P)-binding domain-containing protein [Cryobacterium breve]